MFDVVVGTSCTVAPLLERALLQAKKESTASGQCASISEEVIKVRHAGSSGSIQAATIYGPFALADLRFWRPGHASHYAVLEAIENRDLGSKNPKIRSMRKSDHGYD